MKHLHDENFLEIHWLPQVRSLGTSRSMDTPLCTRQLLSNITDVPDTVTSFYQLVDYLTTQVVALLQKLVILDVSR
ncbi:hypothetical protein TNCT_658961 [Trichonephila clavata]|uniref:Uncharacterized protein n=1 Tax=Trichonephila clavata TaxID=2740835 RepID=A0A8X6HIN2_TRICU|nr:hypothetical protein TNCT_658961 [Trichonephila clavata]